MPDEQSNGHRDDARGAAAAMKDLGLVPEQYIEDEDEWMFTAQKRAESGGGPDRELERDFIEPRDVLVKSLLSDTQTVGIPVVELLCKIMPEFNETDEQIASWFLERHEKATMARDGEARDDAREIIKAMSGVGSSSEETQPGVVMQQLGAGQEEDDE